MLLRCPDDAPGRHGASAEGSGIDFALIFFRARARARTCDDICILVMFLDLPEERCPLACVHFFFSEQKFKSNKAHKMVEGLISIFGTTLVRLAAKSAARPRAHPPATHDGGNAPQMLHIKCRTPEHVQL